MGEVEMKQTGVCSLFHFVNFQYHLFSTPEYLPLCFYSIIQFSDWWYFTTYQLAQ